MYLHFQYWFLYISKPCKTKTQLQNFLIKRGVCPPTFPTPLFLQHYAIHHWRNSDTTRSFPNSPCDSTASILGRRFLAVPGSNVVYCPPRLSYGSCYFQMNISVYWSRFVHAGGQRNWKYQMFMADWRKNQRIWCL